MAPHGRQTRVLASNVSLKKKKKTQDLQKKINPFILFKTVNKDLVFAYYCEH